MAICTTQYHTHAGKSKSTIHLKDSLVSKEDSKCHESEYNGMPSSGTALPVMTDGIPFLPSSDDHLRNVLPEGRLRKCPNAEEGGENGRHTTHRTQEQDGSKRCCNNAFVVPSSRGWGRGQGNGDDEDDDEQPTDYKKKWLGCDGNKQKVKMADKSKMSVLKSFVHDQGASTNFRLDKGSRHDKAGDEVDACMAEQAVLLSREKSSQGCPQNRVIYSTQHGHVISFVQHLFQTWARGSVIDPGLSEGVISVQNLTLNSAQQYRFGEEFSPFAELGRGDFGVTRACYDWKTRMRMATKEIPREKFLPFEVLQLSKVRSPFIARFLGATAERSSLYLHMELVDNAVQLEWIANEGHMLLGNQDTIVQIFFQLLGALDCLHRNKIVHRDLTCRNVLYTAADRVKVIDFNLAVPAPYEQTAMPVGDMAYLAPEVLDGERFLTSAIDWWSVGIIIISLLRGSPQFDDCEQLAQFGYHPLQCCHLNHCHPALRDILEQILNPDWQLRPPPSDLIRHRVFDDSVTSRDELEEYPARPASSDEDHPDYPYILHDEEDPTSHLHNDRNPAPVLCSERDPSSPHSRVLPPLSSSSAVNPPSSLGEGKDLPDGIREEPPEHHREHVSVRPKKEKKIRRFHLAASFTSVQSCEGETQCKVGHGCDAVVGRGSGVTTKYCCQTKDAIQSEVAIDHNLARKDFDVGTQQCGSDEARVSEPCHTEVQGAVGGMMEETTINHHTDSALDLSYKADMESVVFHKLSGLKQTDVYGENSSFENEAMQLTGDRFGTVTNSFNAREQLFEGYGYPEEWLYTQGLNQQQTEEENIQQSDTVEAAVSSHQSSFRETSREESSLENEIFLQQLSSDTSLEFQEKLYRHMSGEDSPS